MTSCKQGLTPTMSIAHLPERGVLRIDGEDARPFLEKLITNDLSLVTTEQAGYGALLSPQGKIMADFIMIGLPAEEGGGYLFDMPLSLTPDFAKKLALYKLRAKVAITDLSESAAVVAVTDGGRIAPEAGVVYADPRFGALGDRAIVSKDDVATLATATADDYVAHRIGLGVPDGGKDFAYEGTFPHEAMLDQLGGVSFTKGCFVGQEVVSRMEHRGTARTRCVPIRFVEGLRSEWGVGVTIGDKQAGVIGSTAAGRGLAMVRLDRIADGLAAGEPLRAGGLDVELVKAPFIRFPFPGEAGFGAAGSGGAA
jgi:hypothetical protein